MDTQKLGDTVLIWDAARLVALGVCHCGPGSEAGSNACYIKFGAARSGSSFEALLDACEALAATQGLSKILAGANAEAVPPIKANIGENARGYAPHEPNLVTALLAAQHADTQKLTALAA